MRLDFRSVMLSFSVMSLLSICLIGAYAAWSKPRRRETSMWVYAYALITIGAALITFRDLIPDFFSVILSNALTLESPVLILAGIRRAAGRKTSWTAFVSVALAATLWACAFTYLFPSLLARLVFYDIAGAALFGAAAYVAARTNSLGTRDFSRIIAALLGTISALALARLAWTLARGVPTGLMSSGRADTAILLAVGGALSLLAVAFVLLHLNLANRELAELASDRSLLLREMAHRTKNDLLLVDSLISIDQLKVEEEDPTSSARLSSLRDRIRCVAQAHEGLSRSEEPGTVRLDEYLESIAQGLQGRGGIRVERSFQKATVPFSLAAPLGLLMNELATNAIKYAFPGGRQGRITLSLSLPPEGSGEAPGKAELEVRDDGVGTSWPPERQGLGTAIVLSLTEKIRGTLSFSGEGGSVFTLRFPLGSGPAVA